MAIQWYPGHMHKARKEMEETLPKVDLILEVLDARIPYSSQNPLLSELRGDKPCIRVLNKQDLADPQRTLEWQHFMQLEQMVKTLAVSCQQTGKTHGIIDQCAQMLPEKVAARKSVLTLVVGIPNVGKSSLINLLAGRSIAKTGNEPAITRRQQRIRLAQNITLSDTPGVLWPHVENPASGYRLAATGAIRDTAISHAEVAYFTASFLLQDYPELLASRFRLEHVPDTETELLEVIAKRRGCLRAGHKVDLDKAAKVLLTELRSGALGQVTLETPTMMEEEMRIVQRVREEKAALKAARKQRAKRRRGIS